MLRLLIVFLILQGSAAKSEDTEGNSSGDIVDDGDTNVDDEDDYRKDQMPVVRSDSPRASPGSDKSTADKDAGGATMVIIISAVCVTILVIGGIVAAVLFRRYLQSREQGVYSVPAEQGQKAAV